MLLDTEAHHAHLIDAAGASIENDLQTVELPVNVTVTVPRAGDHDELLLLSRGQRADGQKEDVVPTLTAMGPDGELRSYELGGPFDTLRQSTDGRYAVLNRGGGGDGPRLNNATEIAVVDLEAAPDGGVTVSPLSNLGEAPREVVFGPPMEIAGETRRLAVLFGSRKLALLDLNHPGRRETAVELTSDLDRQVTPIQVLFDPTEARLFVRARGAADIYSLRLQGPVDNPGGNDFRPTIDLIDIGGGASQIALTVRDGAPMLIGAGGTTFTLVDVNSGRSQQVPTPLSVGNVTLVELAGQDEPGTVTELLLWGEGARRVIFGDLDEVLTRGDRALELSTELSQGLRSLRPLPGSDRLVGVQDNGLTVVDVATRSLTPYTSQARLTAANAAGGAGLVDETSGRVWVAPTGEATVSYLDLATGNTGEVVLDAQTKGFVVLPDAGRVAVLHPLRIGHVTFLEIDAPKRATAQSIRGFFAKSLLD